ncbi:MAG: hypothetical protein RJA37_829 [Verrucomicrobiota bacterium]|jgi:hypothetical protein
MNNRSLHSLLLATLLAAAPVFAVEDKPADSPEKAQLSAARRKAAAEPEVVAASQQHRADKALADKARADYQSARKKAEASEADYRKKFDEALAKADPEAPALVKKEKDAFRERMAKARASKKASEKDGEEDDAGR